MTDMEIQLAKVRREDETTLRNLYQFYMYEFAKFMNWAPNYAGRFDETDLDGCWTDKKRYAYLIRVDGHLAGFAIVDSPDSSCFATDENPGDPVAFMSEFFIMGAAQGQGVGERIAVLLFSMFPGKWEVLQLNQNVNAQAFWRKVIGRYTDGQYEERPFRDFAVVQMFETRIS